MRGKSEKPVQIPQEKEQSLMKIQRLYPLFVATLPLFATKRAFQFVILRPKRRLWFNNHIRTISIAAKLLVLEIFFHILVVSLTIVKQFP